MSYIDDYNDLKYLSISNESFSETIDRLIAKFIEKIEQFIKWITDTASFSVPLLALKNRLDSVANKTHSGRLVDDGKEIKIEENLRYLSINFSPIKDIKVLSGCLVNLDKMTRDIFTYKDLLVKTDIEDFEQEDLSAFKYFNKHNLFKERDSELTSFHLIGSRQITIDRMSNLKMINSNDEAKSLEGPFVFKRMSATTQSSLLKDLGDIVKSLIEHYTGKNRNQMVGKLNQLKDGLKRLRADKTSSESDIRAKMINITLFTNRLNALELDLYNLNKRVVEVCLNIAEQNLAKD